MNQAIHIFRKDVRRLWIEIVLLMLAIGVFAGQDIAGAPFPNGGLGFLFEFIVAAMVWFLIARAVHQEALTGENQFWLTRPYERGSLLGAKVLMVLFVVAVPLFVADCVILTSLSLGTVSNLGGLLLKQLLTATWLILPPLAIASVTRAIVEDVLAWLVVFAIRSIFYFPRGVGVTEFETAKEYEIALFALFLLILALWHQYYRRGTLVSRALIAAAVLLPALPIPEFAALAVAQFHNDSAAAAVVLTVGSDGDRDPMVVHAYPNYFRCAPIDVSVQGVTKAWRLEVLSQKDTFESGDKVWTRGWRETGVGWGHFNNRATLGTLNACATPEGVAELGTEKPITVHTSVVLGIYANDAVKSVRAQWEPFDVPGIGRCQFQHYLREENYMLTCANPLRYPPHGSVAIPSESSLSGEISNYDPSFAPSNMLSGISPVSKWTMATDNQVRQTVAAGGQLQFRPQSRIAVIEREVTVEGVHLQ